MCQEKPHHTTDTEVDIATTDAAIVRVMTSMRGQSPHALLGCIYEVAKQEYGFQGNVELALRIIHKLPGVRVEQHSPLDQTRVFSDYWKRT